jgi:hypothetical protein
MKAAFSIGGYMYEGLNLCDKHIVFGFDVGTNTKIYNLVVCGDI